MTCYLAVYFIYKIHSRNSLAVQWLGLRASTAGGTGSIPGRGTKILHAAQYGQKKKKKKKEKFILLGYIKKTRQPWQNQRISEGKKYHKQLMQLNIKKQITQSKSGQKT